MNSYHVELLIDELVVVSKYFYTETRAANSSLSFFAALRKIPRLEKGWLSFELRQKLLELSRNPDENDLG